MEPPYHRPSEAMIGYCSRVANMIETGTVDQQDDPIEMVVESLSETQLMLIVFDALEYDESLSEFFVESLPYIYSDDEKVNVRRVVCKLACEIIYNEASTNPLVWEHYERIYTEDDGDDW